MFTCFIVLVQHKYFSQELNLEIIEGREVVGIAYHLLNAYHNVITFSGMEVNFYRILIIIKINSQIHAVLFMSIGNYLIISEIISETIFYFIQGRTHRIVTISLGKGIRISRFRQALALHLVPSGCRGIKTA